MKYLPRLVIGVSLLLALVDPVFAYIGPGAGIPVIGSLFGLIATIFVAIGAILFWPIRKVLKRRKKRAQEQNAQAEQAPAQQSSES